LNRLSLLLFVIILNVSGKNFAQQQYTITYESFSFYIFDSAGNPVKPVRDKKINTQLVINDQQSYYYTVFNGNKPIEPGKVLGKSFLPHTNYVHVQKNILISQFGDKYRVKEPLTQFNWQMLPDKKIIAGYESKKAYCIYKGDSIVVTYSEKLPAMFGPYTYTGLPGTILETDLFRKETIYRTTALKVENSANPIVEPNNGKLITWEQWKKIIANRRSNNGVIRVVRW
jgi:GLPGLI family protein